MDMQQLNIYLRQPLNQTLFFNKNEIFLCEKHSENNDSRLYYK